MKHLEMSKEDMPLDIIPPIFISDTHARVIEEYKKAWNAREKSIKEYNDRMITFIIKHDLEFPKGWDENGKIKPKQNDNKKNS